MKYFKKFLGLFLCMVLFFQLNGVFAYDFKVDVKEAKGVLIVGNRDCSSYGSAFKTSSDVLNKECYNFVYSTPTASNTAPGSNGIWPNQKMQLIEGQLVGVTMDGSNADSNTKGLINVESGVTLVLSAMLDSYIAPSKAIPAINLEPGSVLDLSDHKFSKADYLGQAPLHTGDSYKYAKDRLEAIGNNYDSVKDKNFKVQVKAAPGAPGIMVNRGATLVIRGNDFTVTGANGGVPIQNDGTVIVVRWRGNDTNSDGTITRLRTNLRLNVDSSGTNMPAISGMGDVFFLDPPEQGNLVIRGGTNVPAIDLRKRPLPLKYNETSVYNRLHMYKGTLDLSANGQADALRVDGGVVVVAGASLNVTTNGKGTYSNSVYTLYRGIRAFSLYVGKSITNLADDQVGYDITQGGSVRARGGINAGEIRLEGGNIYAEPGDYNPMTVVTNRFVALSGNADIVCPTSTTAAGFPEPAGALGLNAQLTTLEYNGQPLLKPRLDANGVVVTDSSGNSIYDKVSRPGRVLLRGGTVKIKGIQTGAQVHYLDCSGGTHSFEGGDPANYTGEYRVFPVQDIHFYCDSNFTASYEGVYSGGSLRLPHKCITQETRVNQNLVTVDADLLRNDGLYFRQRSVQAVNELAGLENLSGDDEFRQYIPKSGDERLSPLQFNDYVSEGSFTGLAGGVRADDQGIDLVTPSPTAPIVKVYPVSLEFEGDDFDRCPDPVSISELNKVTLGTGGNSEVEHSILPQGMDSVPLTTVEKVVGSGSTVYKHHVYLWVPSDYKRIEMSALVPVGPVGTSQPTPTSTYAVSSLHYVDFSKITLPLASPLTDCIIMSDRVTVDFKITKKGTGKGHVNWGTDQKADTSGQISWLYKQPFVFSATADSGSKLSGFKINGQSPSGNAYSVSHLVSPLEIEIIFDEMLVPSTNGSVTLTDVAVVGTSSRPVTVKLMTGESSYYAFTNNASNNSYSIEDVSPGTYNILISRPGCLSYTITEVPVSDTVNTRVSGSNVILVPGKASSQGISIGRDDVLTVFAAILSSGDVSAILKANTDLDDSGAVTLDDLAIVRQNYGKSPISVKFSVK